jgi:hypothetical protein
MLLEYVSLTELGTLFGTTSHWIGRDLAAMGLWVPCGKPTPLAYCEGLINSREYDSGCEYPLNTWHREKTVAVLVARGRKLKTSAQVVLPQPISKYIVATLKTSHSSASKP